METLTTDVYDADRAFAYLANGLIGLLLPQTPLLRGQARVSGCYGLSPEYGTECLSEVPFPLGLRIAVDKAPLEGHAAAFHRQSYDLRSGEMSTEAEYQTPAGPVRLESLAFCSRSLPSVAVQRVTVTASAACCVVAYSKIEAGSLGDVDEVRSQHEDADWICRFRSPGGLSAAGVGVVAVCEAPRPVARVQSGFVIPLEAKFQVRLEAGEKLTITRFAALVPGRMHAEPHWQALRLVRAARWRGFDELREANRAAWADLWRGRVVLHGAEKSWQELADAAFFWIQTSAHPSMPCSVPPYGLSAPHYNGHVFWDTETFMFPPLLLTAPESARAMLDYRLRCLPTARANAALNGYRGAMFPWESGHSGCEVTPVWSNTSEQHHITLDIAFACLQYAWATGDEGYTRRELWPLLEAVCEWIVSRVTRTASGAEIRHVVGIDESIGNVDNNAYTNIAAKLVLRGAAGLAERLGIVAPSAAWRALAEALYVPVDPALGVVLKHDRYRYEKGPCVPETLAALFPLTWRGPDPAVEAATYDYHLRLAETTMNQPMLSSLYGVWAARRGDRRMSLACFEGGIKSFLCEPFRSFCEWRGRPIANFLTNPAGFLNALYLGLTGLQVDDGNPKGWGKYPIVLPEGWDGLEIERLWVRGRPARLRCRHGEMHAAIEFDVPGLGGE
jgi:trehalose/maltose hydrolase-like predicted phosphorylase